MSVRHMKRRSRKTGSVFERWYVDVDYELPTASASASGRCRPSSRGEAPRSSSGSSGRLDGSYFKSAGGLKPEVPTLEEFEFRFLTYSDVNNKPSTVYAKRWMMKLHLRPFFGHMKLDAIGPAEIEEFKAKKLAEDQSKKSINNHLGALRKVLSLAVEWGVIPKAPKVRGFRFKSDFITEDQFLSFEEADRVTKAAAPEWRTFIILALKTGLRVGEQLALKWEDVDLVAGQLVVRRTLWQSQEGPPKGGRNRKVPLSDEAVAALKGHRHLKGPYVFCEEDGRRLTHGRVKDVVPNTCRRRSSRSGSRRMDSDTRSQATSSCAASRSWP